MKPLRWMLYSLLGIVTIILVGVVTLITLINPNDYKDQLSELVHEKTGMVLALDGDIAWQFYPSIGFAIENASLSLHADKPTLASIKRAAVSVEVWPLFSKKLHVNELSMTGLSVDLIIDEAGDSNWALTTPRKANESSPLEPSKEPTPTDKNPATDLQALPEIQVPLISLNDSRIHYHDKIADNTLDVRIQSFTAKDIKSSEFFPIHSDFTVIQNPFTIKSTLDARIKADDQNGVYKVEGLSLTTTVDGVSAQPLALGVTGTLAVDMTRTKLTANLSPRLANMSTTLTASIENFASQPQVSAELSSNAFNLKTLLTALGVTPPKTSAETALTKVQVNAVLQATDNSLSVQPLTLNLDTSTLHADVNVENFDDPRINFKLALDQLTIDDYLPPSSSKNTPQSESTPPNATTSPVGDETLFPIDTLKPLKLNGIADVNRLQFQNYLLEALHLEVSANNGVIRLKNLALNTFDGRITGSGGLNVSKPTPTLYAKLTVDNIEVASTLKAVMDQPLLGGKTSINVDVNGRGNSTSALLRDSIGNLTFQLDDGVLKGVNLNRLITEGLQDHLGPLRGLVPDIEKHLPASAGKDTILHDVASSIQLKNGVLTIPDFKANGAEGDINATGQFNMIEQSFQSNFDIRLSKLQRNKYLGNTRWPIKCKGSVADPASSWCKLDSNQVKRILSQAAQEAAKVKVAEKLSEKLKLGEKGFNANSEEPIEDQLKQHAKDKLNKELDRQLNKMFGF